MTSQINLGQSPVPGNEFVTLVEVVSQIQILTADSTNGCSLVEVRAAPEGQRKIGFPANPNYPMSLRKMVIPEETTLAQSQTHRQTPARTLDGVKPRRGARDG